MKAQAACLNIGIGDTLVSDSGVNDTKTSSSMSSIGRLGSYLNNLIILSSKF